LLLRKESAVLGSTRAQQRRVEQDRERAQARLVSAWTGELHLGELDEWVLHMHLRNASDEPVSDVEAHFLVDGTAMVAHWRVLGPGEDRLDPAVVPGRGTERPRVGDAHIIFTDAEGRRWERLGGALKRVME